MPAARMRSATGTGSSVVGWTTSLATACVATNTPKAKAKARIGMGFGKRWGPEFVMLRDILHNPSDKTAFQPEKPQPQGDRVKLRKLGQALSFIFVATP